MSKTHPLYQDAIGISNRFPELAATLEAELREIEERKEDVEARLHAARRARERNKTYQHKIGPDLQCPNCWIRQGAGTALNPIPSSTSDDLFKCRECGYGFIMTFHS